MSRAPRPRLPRFLRRARPAGARWAAVVLLLGAAWQGASCSPPPLQRRHDAPAAHAEALQTGRPALVVYAAPWCAACRALGEALDAPAPRRALGRLGAQVIVVAVSASGTADASVPADLEPGRAGVEGLPSLRWLGRSGTLTPHRVSGYLGPQALAAFIQAAGG